MKKIVHKLSILAMLLLLIGCLHRTAFMQGTDGSVEIPGDPELLLKTADTIFPKSGISQDYSENQGYVNEYATESVIHQYFIYDGVGTDRLFSLLPARETVRTTNKRLAFHQARLPEFHVTYSVKKSEEIPDGAGGRCWIRYSDVAVTGSGRESGVIIFPGDGAYFFSPGEDRMTYEKIADLSPLDPAEMIHFDFIRIGSTTHVYTDGGFSFSYTDGIGNGVSFEAGAELAAGGTCIRCDFDDFSVRIR